MKKVLTGIQATGMPHLGNYLGAIKPGIELANSGTARCLYFIADYHALNSHFSPEKLEQITYEVAASWISMGLDPTKSVIYRQSDIPEIFELAWILSCSATKGLLNRAHSYKAAVAANEDAGKKDLDHGVMMGLFTYPILMAADILLFDTELVPVGPDQVQHIEIARDIAQRFNREYGEVLVLPEFSVGEGKLIQGLDGRKMSKSYNNHIPIFEEPKQLRKKIMKFKTDSSAPEDPKDPDDSLIFDLYKLFASESQQSALADRYAKGIGWGDAKQELFDVINTELEGPRVIYNDLMADKSQLDQILKDGAAEARSIARVTLDRVRKSIGAKVHT